MRLSIPTGPAGEYRLAQLDDTHFLSRREFLWQPPFSLSLRARVSARDLPGTWGFGLWNDPFTASLGFGGVSRRLPVLPNAGWFFHASEVNHLTLSDDTPGCGFLSSVFSSPGMSLMALTPAVIFLPFLAWPGGRRLLRRMARSLVRDDSRQIQVDETSWHGYQLACFDGGTQFLVDGQLVFETGLLPQGRLGLVVWIDNQFAAFAPTGQVRYGTQENAEPAWLEISSLKIQSI